MDTYSLPGLARVLLILAAPLWVQADDGAAALFDIPRVSHFDTGDNVVAVILHFEEPMPPPTFAAMQNEVARMMRPTGLTFQWWRSVYASFGTAPHVVVARFKGVCNLLGPAKPDGSSTALGSTYLEDRRPISFCEVDCDRVRNFVQAEASHACPQARECLLGTALGRVLVHELYHILAETRQHGRSAISRPGVRPWDLVGPDTALDPRDVKAIERKTSQANGVRGCQP